MCVQRPVRRGVGHVLEEGPVRVLGAVAAQELDRLVADRVGVEEARRPRLVFGVVVAARERVGVIETAGADDGAEEVVETALHGPGIGRLDQVARHVPLATEIAAVARGLEHLGDGGAALVQVAGVAFRARVIRQDANAGLMRVQTREQRRARRTAARRVVELREAQAVTGQPVQMGRVDFAAVAADVGIAHVVVEDQKNVRTLAHGHFLAINFQLRRSPLARSNRWAAPGSKPTCTASPSRSAFCASVLSLSRCSPSFRSSTR